MTELTDVQLIIIAFFVDLKLMLYPESVRISYSVFARIALKFNDLYNKSTNIIQTVKCK